MTKAFPRSLSIANYLVLTVLALVPFHAFLTVYGASIVGHYTLLRLWDDSVLVVLLGIVSYWVVKDRALRSWLCTSLLMRLISAYAVLTILLGGISYTKHEVTAKALCYGLLINLRYLVWFLAVITTVRQSDFLARNWQKVVLLSAGVVVIFGLAQYTLLPHNFLAHFGYNAQTTIAPIETINHNQRYIRVQSTLRGANPLGAYLVIVLAVAAACALQARKKVGYVLFGLAALGVLYASGSRSAWIGSLLALLCIGWARIKTKRTKQYFMIGGLILAVVLTGVGLLLRNNVSFENALLHTQKNSAVATSSNAGHASALKDGLNDVLHQPFGDGPGTAGQASVYNAPHPGRIAEDYYVQIAQETGWLGLALFLTIIGLVVSELYRRKDSSNLALIAFGSLVGISAVNLLSHAWSDDTLAYVWWGLAGIAVGMPLLKGKYEIQD